MKIPNDYMAMSYRMEIVEDKDEGGFEAYFQNSDCETHMLWL